MKVISEGSHFSIHSNDIETYDLLPPNFYEVKFSPMMGYSLKRTAPLEIKEQVYGTHLSKIGKVLHHFQVSERNTGIILSGAKGIGKSFFAKDLCIRSVAAGIPVIMVTQNTPQLCTFINSIEQEVLILFDEFDKVFKEHKDTPTTQEDMLSMFDGISVGKKLFVITCNHTSELSDFILNRPGRFHYHFRFSCPSAEEIEIYMKDKLEEKYYPEIEKVKSFSQRIDLNYDCLRSIVTELSYGVPFEEAIQDLNILRMEPPAYDIICHFKDGSSSRLSTTRLDVGEDCTLSPSLYNKDGLYLGELEFNTKEASWDESLGYIILPQNLHIDWRNSDDEEIEKLLQEAKPNSIVCLQLKRRLPKDIHYTV